MQLVYLELTTCSSGEPLLYLKMVLMTHFFAGEPRPDLEVHLALMKLALVPVRLVPGAPLPVLTLKSARGRAATSVMWLKSSHFPPW